MKIYKTLVLIAFLFCTQISDAISQSQRELPAAFMMGDFGADANKIGLICNTILLQVCNDSMDLAYGRWLELLVEIEELANKLNVDLRGVKIWMNVYWNSDGTIRHIVYHPKPNSKNLDFEELTAFFSTFVNRYDGGLSYEECYSHYGSVNFPTFAELYLRSSR